MAARRVEVPRRTDEVRGRRRGPPPRGTAVPTRCSVEFVRRGAAPVGGKAAGPPSVAPATIDLLWMGVCLDEAV